jgi:hypothetical protein
MADQEASENFKGENKMADNKKPEKQTVSNWFQSNKDMLLKFGWAALIIGAIVALVLYIRNKATKKSATLDQSMGPFMANGGKWLKAIFLLLLIFFAFIVPAVMFSKYYAIISLFSSGVTLLKKAGINPWFAKAIVAILIVPFLTWGVPYFLSPSSKKRKIGSAIIASYFVCYFLFMGISTRGVYKDALFDPFNKDKAEALVYVARDFDGKLVRTPEGRIELFKSGERHPRYGTPLEPITPEIISLMDREERERVATDSLAQVSAKRADSVRVAEEQIRAIQDAKNKEAAQAEKRRSDFLNRYLSGSPSGGFSPKSVIILATKANENLASGRDSDTETRLLEQLRKAGWAAKGSVFTQNFYSEGYPAELLGRNTTILRNLGAKNYGKYVLVVKGTPGYSTQSGLTKKTICSLKAEYCLLNTESGEVAAANQVNTGGSGADNSTAYNSAAQKAVDQIIAQLNNLGI